jgi:hypothetical protein
MKPSYIRALAAGALLLAASTAVNAQTTAQSGSSENAASTPWAALPTGVYKLDIQLPERVMPATITIKDSSGTPTATLLPDGDQDAHPVKVTVKGTELVLNGDAEKGPFEIVMLRQGDQITGRWSYGGDTGKLTGKAEN